jgi:hypothetical protein
MFSNRFTTTTLAATGALLLCSPAFAGRDICYDIETVNVQDDSGNDLLTIWYGINNPGVMVGEYCQYIGCDPFVAPGIVYDSRDGTFESFWVDGFDEIAWSGINDWGKVVFEAFAYDAEFNIIDAASFVRDPGGEITQLDFPGTGVYVDTQAINNAGTIAGLYYDLADGRYHGVIWEDGEYTIYDVPVDGLPHTLLLDITNDGTLVGIAYNEDFSAWYSFVDDGRDLTWIDYGEGALTMAEGGNDRGQVVGTETSTGVERSFVYSHGTFDTIDIEGALSSVPFGINDHGVVAGTWGDESSQYGFVATPVPCRRR